MKKSLIIGLVLLFICSILSCQNPEELKITDLKYEIQCGYVFICWYTNEPTLSTIYTCTGNTGTCQVIAFEPEIGQLHQLSVCTSDQVTKYQIKVTNSSGKETWKEFDNPYILDPLTN